MSTLDRVTISGADVSVFPNDLAKISKEHPFVEWGILVSHNRARSPRYPGLSWMGALAARPEALNISIHVQGRWLRQLLLGDPSELKFGVGDLLNRAQRIQLNFHGAPVHCLHYAFSRALRKHFADKQIIFQQDGGEGAKLMQTLAEISDDLNCVAFFDTSHGAGILPPSWPEPHWMLDDVTYDYHGYAGGLGPENLAQQIPIIAKAKKNGRFWIDMETKVRTEDRFDLSKVKQALEICKPLIGVTL